MTEQKVLIVDDERSNIRILAELLREDYDLYIATNGTQALEIALSDNMDLILLDVVMPGMDGYEVCQQLKADERTQDIPIIFATSKDSQEDEEKGLQIGAVDYISKPYRLPIIKTRVKIHLEMKRRGDLLQQMACLDSLTGIANRRRFDDFIDSEWRRAVRQGTMMAVVLMDVDHFKLFNDNYGHTVGDDCLAAVAKALSGCVQRSSDLVARYGGEEFVCVLTECTHEAAVKVAEKLRQQVDGLSIPHSYCAAEHVTISVGVASMIPTLGTSTRILVEAADRVLYQAKDGGRNQVASIAA